jgi:membrane protein YdbS with pleckstrin-like domain
MPYPDNLLVDDEKIYVRKRPHWKVLILPTVFFILIVGGCAALIAIVNNRGWNWPSWAYWAVIAVAVIALIVLVLVPFIRWRTEHFVISNHHIFFRTGLLSRREHQIPLGQIANMETEVTFWGRLMGYGSLIVESSADQPLKFRNVASLPKVQAMLNQLIRDEKELTHRSNVQVDDYAAGDADRGRQDPTPPQAPQPAPGQWAASPAASRSASWPIQAEQGGQQPGHGPHAQPGYGQGHPQQTFPQPGYTQAYPPAGYRQGYPQEGYQPQDYQQGYQPQGYQQEGYPQQGYPQGYAQQPGYQQGGYPTAQPGSQHGQPQPAWGGAPTPPPPSTGAEPPPSAEPTVLTRSPSARGADGPAEPDGEPTVLTQSPYAGGQEPVAPSAPRRGRHAEPTASTPLPKFHEPEPTVAAPPPSADADPEDTGSTPR